MITERHNYLIVWVFVGQVSRAAIAFIPSPVGLSTLRYKKFAYGNAELNMVKHRCNLIVNYRGQAGTDTSGLPISNPHSCNTFKQLLQFCHVKSSENNLEYENQHTLGVEGSG